MNITKENIDKLNAVLTLTLEKPDYENRVSDVLSDYRKKARIDGFRPGKVPLGLINKMYRKPVLVEEINKLVSESISKYLVEQKLNILGEPLPHEGEQKTINWDTDEKFEFKLDLGLAPEFEINLSPKEKIPYYNIKIDDTLINKHIERYTQQFGEFISVEKPQEKDLIRAEIRQLDADQHIAGEGIFVEQATLSVEMIKDDKIRKQFLEVKKEDKLVADLKKAYPSNAELSALLKIDKEKAAALDCLFELTIKDISRFKNADVNQELYDKIYGPGNVKTEDEFRTKISEEVKNGVKQDSEYRFRVDVKEILIGKNKLELPQEFLKRWLFTINEGKFTAEQIDKDFDSFSEDLKWQLIKDKILDENKLEASEDEIKAVARDVARMQFAQYGMTNIPDEHLNQFTERMLEKKEDKNNIRTRVLENKVIEYVRTAVKVDEKEISLEKFNKLFEK
jgi:trigger factor